MPRKIGFNSKAINAVHCVKFTLCVAKMRQTLKQRYEGPSIKDVRKSGGGSGVLRGGDDGGGGGTKFQLFLGCRKSHKGKIHVSKISRQKYLYG